MSRVSQQQADLFSVARARWSDPATSRRAAESITSEKITEVQEMVLTSLRIRPAHDEELVARFRNYWPERRISAQSIRSRRAELVRRGLVRDTGQRARTAYGKETIVWGAP